ncbi:UrcA family protein [Sphingomonas sp.]|uniref:UrcA family protein n=1 Tax=Sphingomonas sp. TaxID=28214 RepID=UPI001B1B34F6|nr:UrcA family protein [Sphingomonas sp.]MBO9712772.1 UrcA family protein [Sphingomonas sp.]
MNRTAAVTAALFAALFVAPIVAPVPALAAEDGKRVHVTYADLDLSTPQGVGQLDRRLAKAVNSACEATPSRALSQALALRHCRDTALASVAEQRVHAIASHRSEIQVAGGR